MNIDQVGTLLKALAAYDQRKIGEGDFLVWGRQMAEIELEDALEAAHEHYDRTRDRAMPADIKTGARKRYNARTKRPEVFAPGCYEPDPVERARLAGTVTAEGRAAIAGAPPTAAGRAAARAVAELAASLSMDRRLANQDAAMNALREATPEVDTRPAHDAGCEAELVEGYGWTPCRCAGQDWPA